MVNASSYHFIFIAGLHKSGTTLLADCLKHHPDIGSFDNTGFPEDEGQFLQTVFPPAREHGGPGKFGFNNEMHITENSTMVNSKNKNKLFSEWSRYWDLRKTYLLEKSPPNIIKMRFLQEMFCKTYFIIITRHPVAVSYATLKWSKTSIDELLLHWVNCHNILCEDLKHVNNKIVLKYEDFVEKPDSHLRCIYDYLGIRYKQYTGPVEKTKNIKYEKQWDQDPNKYYILEKYEKYSQLFQSFGYYLNEL